MPTRPQVMTVKSASGSSEASRSHLAQNFEGFNWYAGKAMQLDEDAEIYANLAVAFEISQLRYQLSQQRREAA